MSAEVWVEMAEAVGVKVPHLVRLRKRLVWTQRELAERAGVSVPVIVAGENGRPISLKSVRKLAKALRVKPAALMAEEQEE